MFTSDAKSESLSTLNRSLSASGVKYWETESGCWFSSLRERFAPFASRSPIVAWDTAADELLVRECTCWIAATSHRIWFASGSVLLIFPSGHIRWGSELAFRCYSVVSQSRAPDYWQGDLVAFQLASDEQPIFRDNLLTLLKRATEPLWCQPLLPAEDPIGVWFESQLLPVGGNRRHLAHGRLRYRFLWEEDRRTVQIHTLEPVTIQHDPLDGIHPRIDLPAGMNYLITKLPGFSDPARELLKSDVMVP